MHRKPRFSDNFAAKSEVKPTFTDRFFKRIKESFEFFQNKNSDSEFEKKLTGRIYELQKTVNEVIDQLHLIKRELSQELGDQELYELVEAIVDPLIKNVDRIRSNSFRGENEEVAYKRYTAWIEKAKIWVQIRSKAKEKDLITQAVIKHTVESFHEIVDRDLQVIQDYEDHMIETQLIDHPGAEKAIQQIQEKLEPYLESLTMLKDKPRSLTIQDLPSWKMRMDKLRETYFEAALHVIDKIVQDIHPHPTNQHDHDQLIDAFKQVAELEEALHELLKEIDQADIQDLAIKKHYFDRVKTYDEVLVQLSSNLYLTPELADRVEALFNLVTKTYKHLR